MENESTLQENTTAQSFLQKPEVPDWVAEFKKAADVIVYAMKEIGRNSDKLTSRVFLLLGILPFLLILRTNVSRLSESPVWSFTQIEFISVVAISTFFIVCGLSLRVFQYRNEREISRQLTDLCVRMIGTRADTANHRQVPVQAPRIPGSATQEKGEGRGNSEASKESANNLSI